MIFSAYKKSPSTSKTIPKLPKWVEDGIKRRDKFLEEYERDGKKKKKEEDKEKKEFPKLFPTSKDVKSNFYKVINMAIDDNDADAARHIFNSLDPDLAAELGIDEDQMSEIMDAMRDIYRS